MGEVCFGPPRRNGDFRNGKPLNATEVKRSLEAMDDVTLRLDLAWAAR